MKLQHLFSTTLIASALAFSTAAFAKDGKIKIGVMAGPEANVVEFVKQIAKEKYNLDVEIFSFTDYTLPNAALVNKSLDINAFQHAPYLERQIADRGWNNLEIVGYTFLYPIAAYSKKIKDISELKDGATVAIPNDPTNGGRALLLLQSKGLIKLKDPKGLTQSVLDIVENPKNLKIQSLDANLIPRTLGQVDFAIINNNFAVPAGLYPGRDAIFVEDKDSPYVNIIVARTDNKDDEDIKNYVKAYNSEEVYHKALEEFQNAVIKGW